MVLASGVRDLADQLAELAEEQRARFALPALALGIARDGELVGFGSTGSIGPDPEAGPPPGPRTAWRVASITKTLTATAIFQLRNHGLLGLDDRLEAHLPEFARAPERGGPRDGVTIRRMLLHHSGLPTETPLPTWGAPEFPTIDQIVDAFDRTEVSIAPGTSFKYSNLAYGLLGEVIARRSEQSYVEYVRTHILGPIEIHDSGFEREDGDLAVHLAASWVPGRPPEGPPRPAPYNRLSGITSAGQLISTAGDLARWLAAQRPGHGVVPDATLAEMQAPVDLATGPGTVRTLGWERTTLRGEFLHGHGGGVYGFSSYVGYHVASGLGLIVLANLWPSRGAAARIAVELFDRALGGDGVPAPAGWTPPADDPLVAPTLAQKRFVGRWFAEPAFPVGIVPRQSGLHLEPSDGGEYALHAPSRLEPVGAEPRRLLALDGRPAGEYLVFDAGSSAAGSFDRFELGGFEYRRD